jgi:predicted amidohydrolase
MLFASKQPRNKTVRAAFEEVTVAHGVKVVPWRDYIFTNRQGINSLRQHGLPILPWLPGDEQQQDGAEGTEAHAIRAGVAPGTCQFPGQHIGPTPVFNRTSGTLENPSRSSFLTALRSNLTCSTGVRSAAPVQLAVEAAETAPQQIYRDVHEFTYDMSPRTSFADAGRVKVASVPGAGGPIDIPTAIAQLKAAKADGALIATLTEEAFGESPGQPIDGPGPTAIRHAAKDIGIAVVCPMRLRDVDGRQYNAAIVIHANGSLAKAVYTGSEMTQKQFPVYGYPLEAPGEAHCQEHNVVPRQTGTSVFDMPGIGRIAIVMCFDVNFPEAWHGAYAMGAQIVFWPTVMGAPDRDVISYARLFRFHVVACGSRRLDSAHMDVKESGMILDTTGETVSDIKVLPSKVVTGTVDLDAEWLHENGPGLITDPSLTRICAAYPGIFEFIIDSDPNRHPGCSRRIYNETDPWQRGTAPDNSAFLFASKFPEIKTVKEAFEEEGLVPWRDYIFGARKGVNSLRLFGLPGLAWGGVEKGPLPAPPLPPLPLPRPLGNVVTAAIITTPELMNPSVVPTSASAVVRAVIEEYANSSQSLALIDATKMTAAQLKPFKVAIVLVALPSSDTLLEFAAAGGSVLVVGGSCRSDTKLQAALGISMNRTADIRTTNADLNVTTRTDKFADAWNLKLPTSRGPSMPVTLSPVSITPNAESFEIANVTIGGATHPWLVARRFGSQYGMLNYLSVPEPIAVRSAVKFIFSSTGLGAYMSRTARAEEYTTDQYGEPISVDDPWSQVAVDHVPASLGLPHRYRVTLLKADPSRWTTKKEYKVMHNKSLCINLYTRWYGRQAPGTVVANIGDGINVVAAQTYRYTTACVSLTHTDNTALARQTAMRSVSPAAPAAHPNSFCCGMSGPSTCSDNAYKYVGNVSVQQCASECAKLRCPCFDYIAKIAHPGFSNCRVLPANVSFKVDSSPSGETAYTTGGTVPVPPPPAAPSSLHLPVSFELLGPLPEGPAGCKSDLDCELNGICSTNAVGAAGARRCECDAGWYGPTCGRLDLLPAHRPSDVLGWLCRTRQGDQKVPRFLRHGVL